MSKYKQAIMEALDEIKRANDRILAEHTIIDQKIQDITLYLDSITVLKEV